MAQGDGVEIGLNAAIAALDGFEPVFLTVPNLGFDGLSGLPFGPFAPLKHRTMEMAVRGFVKEQTGLQLGYIEQLYSFGDRGRSASALDEGEMHVVSIGYLAFTRLTDIPPLGGVWRGWYAAFPWEDWRAGPPDIIGDEILPRLKLWVQQGETAGQRRQAQDRVNICFSNQKETWDEEKVLDRYELLYEAGLVDEARRDGRQAALFWDDVPRLGEPMMVDHRRILATAMSRMRAKIKYRPVIFDLMPAHFTLLQLQKTVEAISGGLLHKQNFRRLVENAGLVEATGKMSADTGGRPAQLFRFRKEVLLERRTAGIRARP